MLTSWCQSSHQQYPHMFKAAVKQLLLAARQSATVSPDSASSLGRQQSCMQSSHGFTSSRTTASSSNPSAAASFCRLPREVMLDILKRAAAPVSCWATPARMPDVSDEERDRHIMLHGAQDWLSEQWDIDYGNSSKRQDCVLRAQLAWQC
eukprot:jgi/Chrzof1/11328/Cz05g32190.t1